MTECKNCRRVDCGREAWSVAKPSDVEAFAVRLVETQKCLAATVARAERAEAKIGKARESATVLLRILSGSASHDHGALDRAITSLEEALK